MGANVYGKVYLIFPKFFDYYDIERPYAYDSYGNFYDVYNMGNGTCYINIDTNFYYNNDLNIKIYYMKYNPSYSRFEDKTYTLEVTKDVLKAFIDGVYEKINIYKKDIQ